MSIRSIKVQPVTADMASQPQPSQEPNFAQAESLIAEQSAAQSKREPQTMHSTDRPEGEQKEQTPQEKHSDATSSSKQKGKDKNESGVGAPSDGLSEADRQAKLADDMTPVECLHYAAEIGNNALIRRAYDAGADVNTPDNGRIELTEEEKKAAYAKMTRKERKEAKIKEESASIYRDRIITGDFPIHKAVAGKHLSTVELLFFLQADLEVKNRIGSTALHRAASKGYVDIVKFLVSKGAKLDAVNAVGNTPMHVAAFCGNNPVMQALVDQAQSAHNNSAYRLLERVNNGGMSVYDYAKKRPMIELLANYRRPATANATQPIANIKSGQSFSIGHTTQKSGSNSPHGKQGGNSPGPASVAASLNQSSAQNAQAAAAHADEAHVITTADP